MTYKEELAKYYDLLYSKKDYEGEVEYIKAETGGFDDKKILDIGCGTGRHATLLAEESSAMVWGIDISDEMIGLAQEKAKELENLQFIHSGVEDLGEKNFDLVVSLFNVVNHIQDLKGLMSFFEHVRDRMNLGGQFVFDCWNGVATIHDLPKREVKTAFNDGVGTLITTYNPIPDLINSRIVMKNVVSIVVLENLVEKFEYELVHRIWTPTLLSELLSLSGFDVMSINKAFVNDKQATATDYKIVFMSRAK